MSVIQNFIQTKTQNIIGSAAKAVITRMSKKRLPRLDGELEMAKIEAPVEILRDRWGVPHIYAQSAQDLYFAQGFVHAQDRLWQMEVNRRVALGQLSELFGEETLDTDRVVRTFGFNRLGSHDWEQATEALKTVLSSYVQGINACIENPCCPLPVEFTLVRHQPSPWRVEDCTALARLMMWKLSHAWYSEIIRAQLIEAVGEKRAVELEIQYPADNPITLPEGIVFNRMNSDGSLAPLAGPFLKRGLGSNAWVVSGLKSDSGQPLLCNDIHLPLSQPGLWYLNHLAADPINVTGVSIPGLPLVLVGHNDRIAWGITLAFTDAEDLFIEKMGAGENAHRYRYKEQWHDAEVIAEHIHVKGRDNPHIENVIMTRHGPIISDAVGVADQKVALCSMALREGRSFEGWRLLNLAQDWDDFVAAMQRIDNTQLNVSYADVEGNIGHWVTGKLPVRAQGDGSIPMPGWTGAHEWQEDVPFEAMPHALNPHSGTIVSCNHRLMPDNASYFLGNAWMNGYRANRIEALLSQHETISSETCQTMMMDVTCLPGIAFVSHLNQLEAEEQSDSVESGSMDSGDLTLDSILGPARQFIIGWDGRLTPDSIGGTIYEVTRAFLVRNLLEPGLGVPLTERLMGRGFHPLLLASHEFYGHDTVTMLRMLDTPDSWWVQQAGGREAVLIKSLKEAVRWLQTSLGPDVSNWQWGNIHQIVLGHPLGVKKPLDRVFNRGPYPVGGDTDTPFQTAHAPGDGYDDMFWAPSFRQIVDVGDWSQSVFAMPSGQSGQLASIHYDDLTQPWLQGEYLPMLWTPAQVKAHVANQLVLFPNKNPTAMTPDMFRKTHRADSTGISHDAD